MSEIPSLAEERAFLRNLDTACLSDESKEDVDEENYWDFEGMATTEEVATICDRGNLREVKRACESGSEAVPAKIIDVTKLVREGVKMKRKNGKILPRRKDLGAGMVEIQFVVRTMGSHILTADARIKALRARLTDARMKLENLAVESARTGGGLWAEMVAIEELFETEKAYSKS